MSDAKKQDLPSALPAGLWVVATPIGNLGDISSRARAALESAGIIYCEDTRQTSKLLHAIGARTQAAQRLERMDAHASPARIAQAGEALQERFSRGEGVALVTDAGTPAVSDPGARLVAEARSRGIPVTPVPGPSAVMALLSAAGFEDTAFAFRGFFPRKQGDRERELSLCARSPVARVYVWFESPNRVAEALTALAERHPGASVVASKELTKLHERFFGGSAADVRDEVARELAEQGERGEWCLAVKFAELDENLAESEGVGAEGEALWKRVIESMLDAGVSASMAARQASQHFGAPKKAAYDLALKLSGKKN